jgi:hypothetical protein
MPRIKTGLHAELKRLDVDYEMNLKRAAYFEEEKTRALAVASEIAARIRGIKDTIATLNEAMLDEELGE